MKQTYKTRDEIVKEIKDIISDSKEKNFKLDWAMIAAFKIYTNYIAKVKV